MMTGALPFTALQTQPSVQLYRGDCLEVMPTLTPGSVHMVFADLPYGATRNSWDVRIEPQAFWRYTQSLCAPSAKTILSATQPFASVMIISNLAAFRYDIIWDKCTITGHLNAKKRPLRRHEHLLLFATQPGVYVPQMTPGVPFRKNINKPSQNYDYFGPSRAVNVTGDRYPTSILSLTAERRTGNHPTQKPVTLLEWLVKTYTKPGDTVLDPTAGSMTTAIAALRTGRHSIMIEKDAAYFEIGRKRIAGEQARLGFKVTV